MGHGFQKEHKVPGLQTIPFLSPRPPRPPFLTLKHSCRDTATHLQLHGRAGRVKAGLSAPTPPNLPFSLGTAASDVDTQYCPRALCVSDSWMLGSAGARGCAWWKSWPGGAGAGLRGPSSAPAPARPLLCLSTGALD